jgi:hypothetical protein
VTPCECDWKTCGHKGREVLAADHGPVVTSLALCMVCLYGCEADREDEMDAES